VDAFTCHPLMGSSSRALGVLPAPVLGPLVLVRGHGNGSYTWSTSATLPSALTLSAAGLLSGTPAAPGSIAFPVTVVDGHNNHGQKAFTLTIN
jgi:hypothetical protein